MPGSGKTEVGRALAAALGRPFVDADDEIVARSGQPIAAIFAAHGEEGFRRIEREVLDDLLGGSEAAVVATGGGCVTVEATRAALAARAAVVWLRAPVGELAARLVGDDTRPLLAGDQAGALAGLAAAREPLYAEVADLTVDVGARSTEEIVAAIVAAEVAA